MKDEEYMRLAIELAQGARGLTNPNPMVGAVVVRDNRIVGRGFHKKAGLPHAEIEALRQAGRRAKGARMYVTLEPCTHYGRTPPCTIAIVKAGIKEVFAAMRDPNPLNNGKGIRELKRNGIKVNLGVLGKQAEELNQVFIKFITQKMPFVSVKAAQSLDGKIATRTGESKWISSQKSLAYVKELRAETDAILVGVNTVLKDDPLLNPAGNQKPVNSNQKNIYYKIVLDAKLRTPPDARIFSKESIGKVILVTTKRALKSKIDLFSRKAVVLVMKDKNGRLDLRLLMKELAKRQISHLLIEGGGQTIALALQAGIVDRILFFIAPKIIGGKEAITAVEGEGAAKLKKAIEIKEMKVKEFGEDLLIEGYIK